MVPEPGPTVSDGEFRESVPPKSLVAMHKDTIESTSSITKKKGIPAGEWGEEKVDQRSKV